MFGGWLEHAFVDERGNIFIPVYTEKTTYVLKLPWVDEDTPPLLKPLEVVPLDGWGRELPKDSGSPRIALDAPGAVLAVLMPKQDLPLEKEPFPVYSLWDYQMSLFQRDNPWAIRGRISGTGPSREEYTSPGFAPVLTIDVNPLPTEGVILVSVADSRVKPYRVPFWRDSSYVLDDALHRTLVSLEIAGRVPPGLGLDPSKPDTLRVPNSTVKFACEMADLFLIETGPDTKVFVTPTVMTRLALSPKELPVGQRASLKAYSKNWLNGKDDQVVLKETEPGSRKFVSEDGTILYEITHILGEKDQVISNPTPQTVDRLYLYLTDSKLGLNRQPQLLFENGVDTGEYWSYAEPPWGAINSGHNKPWSYKHWSQVTDELEKAKFHIELSGPSLAEKPAVELSWDDSVGKRQRVAVPLAPTGTGTFKSTTPLLAFAAEGCDIGGSWDWTEQVPTPQFPGVISFRDKNVQWRVVN